MTLKELEYYIKANKTVTIPEVQQNFGTKYGETRQAFQQLQDEGKIKCTEGVTFEWCAYDPAEERLMKSRQELRERLAKLREQSKVETFEEEDDEEDFDLEELFKGDEDDIDDIATLIINRLAVFNVKLGLSKVLRSASVTRYVFDVLSEKTRMSDLPNYATDIQACTQSREAVRILAPIWGTNQVGIEIANTIKEMVPLESIVESDGFRKSKAKLAFAVGRDLLNNDIVADLHEMPHLLVAGSVGSGKTVVLCNLILSLSQKYSPDYVKFLMVDTKGVDLSRFNGMPHMLTGKAVTTPTEAIAALDYLIGEMERRYASFRECGVGNIIEYNKQATDKLPYLVYIVDELAEIMSFDKKTFESKLQRLAQKSRASGIHLVLATQRPDVRTITGTVKANFPARIALHVSSAVDSATILNQGGAEKLIGRGDMLLMQLGSPELQRLQGAYVSNDELHSIVEGLKAKYPCKFDKEVEAKISLPRRQDTDDDSAGTKVELDPLCKKALRFWLEKQCGRASIASIQRNLGIGFNRAGRIMDSLQKLGYVEQLKETDPSTKPVMVLVTLDQLDFLFPDQED